jgi:hypothetical protein
MRRILIAAELPSEELWLDQADWGSLAGRGVDV